MKINFLIGFLCLFPFCPLFAQMDVEIILMGSGDISPYKNGTKGFDLRYEGVRGTPLLFDDWQTAQLQLVNQDTFSAAAFINVDLAQGVLVIQMRNGSTGQAPLSKIQAFNVLNSDNQSGIWKILPEKEVEGTTGTSLGCYKVLQDGTYSLLKSIKKKFVKASYKEAYSAGFRYDEYVQKVDYWLRDSKGTYQKIKLKQKSIEEALPRQAGRIGRIIKSQKLNASNEKEVVKLLESLEETTQ